MRPVREITKSEENFRLEPLPGFTSNCEVARRDFVKPEPEGTIVLVAFRVTGYDKDCDGSAMARLEQIDANGTATGWEADSIGLGPDCELVVTGGEWREMHERAREEVEK